MPRGRLTITRADPASGVDFLIEMENGTRIEGRIALKPMENGTDVTYADDVDLGGGLAAGWLALILRPMLSSSIEKALTQMDGASRPVKI